ncbi:hypothetical protein ACH5RR_010991 [Cinchona calisaya]|uniref:MULE transposase domain-containing protein n=1 Tax=Cinchona calisaya TaxID=153742 RepID=A0ABD3A732_9GENT
MNYRMICYGILLVGFFSEKEVQQIKEISMVGIAPWQILISLRKSYPKFQTISRTVYNAKVKVRRESLMRRIVIQALFDEFGESGFIFDIVRDKEGHLTHLFFVHPYSIKLTKSYSTVFVIDCTYKTNKYNMPLLEIVSVKSFNTSFYSFFWRWKKKEENDYIWALERFRKILGVGSDPSIIVSDRELALMNAIEIVFPSTKNLLCIWHIEKNILMKKRNGMHLN